MSVAAKARQDEGMAATESIQAQLPTSRNGLRQWSLLKRTSCRWWSSPASWTSIGIHDHCTGAAAMGMKVVLFFTFWGTAALRKPEVSAGGKDFMSKMFGWMLPKGRNKVKLSKMNMAGMGTAMLKGLMRKKNAPSLDQLFDMAAQLGVRIKVCEMSMDLMGFRREEIIDYPNIEYVGVATFLANAGASRNQLFI